MSLICEAQIRARAAYRVVRAVEERLEVGRWLEQVGEPQQGRHVAVSRGEQLSSQTHVLRVALVGCLCEKGVRGR